MADHRSNLRLQDAIKELTCGLWTIASRKPDAAGCITLTALTFRGVELPPSLTSHFLEACVPKPPRAPAATVAAALQPHVVTSIVQFAVETLRDAARLALVDRAWAVDVQGWMLKLPGEADECGASWQPGLVTQL